VITPEQATKAARRGLQALQPRSRITKGVRMGTPLLVKRLDAPGLSYYLVPERSPAGIAAIAQVDASTGSLQSVARLPQPVPQMIISPRQAAEAASDSIGRRLTGAPELVWQPCRESSSPLRPFYRVRAAEHDLFVSIDGQVYEELTPFGKGG